MAIERADVESRIRELERDLGVTREATNTMQAQANAHAAHAVRIEGALTELREMLTSPKLVPPPPVAAPAAEEKA